MFVSSQFKCDISLKEGEGVQYTLLRLSSLLSISI